MARPAVSVVTPHERTEATATTLIGPSSTPRSGREFDQRISPCRGERSHLVGVGRIDLQRDDGIRARPRRRRINRHHHGPYRTGLPGEPASFPTTSCPPRGRRPQGRRDRATADTPPPSTPPPPCRRSARGWCADVRGVSNVPATRPTAAGRPTALASFAAGTGCKTSGRCHLHDLKVARLHHVPSRNGTGDGEHLLAREARNRRHAERQGAPDHEQHPGHDPGHLPTAPDRRRRRRLLASTQRPLPVRRVVSVVTGIASPPSRYDPEAVFTAWDSATRTATCAAGPATWPRFPPPGAPVAVQATCQ